MSGCTTAASTASTNVPKKSSANPPTRVTRTGDAPVATAPATKPASRNSHASDADVSSDTRPLIICFGDSLTAGLGIEPDRSYPANLQRMLDAAGYHYHVINEGVSGDTTKDGLERLEKVLDKKPKIVVLEFGGNDGLRGLPVEQAQHNLAEMIRRLQRSKATVALAGISLPPQYGGDYIAQFNGMYPALARQFHVPLLPFLLKDVYGVDGDIQADGVHPTAQGARQVAVNVEGLIRPLLRR